MNLELLSRKRFYYEEIAPNWVRKIWSRPEAFDHFLQHHRTKLSSTGAIVKIGRDYFVVSDKFPIAAAAILGLSNDVHQEASHAS